MTADLAPAPSHAWYVYGVLPPGGAAPAAPAVLPGARVEAVACGTVAILASLVPRAPFETGEAGRAADPDWIAGRVGAHHAVNMAATEAGACLPLAFGALFSSLERLRAWLAPRAAALRAALGRVAGQAEWALTVREDVAAHAAWLARRDPDLQRLTAAAAEAGAGTAFLMARRLERVRAAARRRHIDAAAARLAARLAAAGHDALAEPPRGGLPAWSFLAPRRTDPDRLAALTAALDTDQEGDPGLARGLSPKLSGPWPAYAFARAALAGEAAHD